MTLDEVLVRVRSAEDEVERARAVEQLGSYEGEKVVLALIDALGDYDQLVQVAAAEGLKSRYPVPGPYLRRALCDASLMVRWGAAELLASYPSPETEVALCGLLTDESPDVRGAAARSLRGMAREATITQLRSLLEDPDSFPRYQALLAIRAFDPQLVDEAQIVLRDLKSVSAPTRADAIHFIRQEGKREWLDQVTEMLNDPDFRVRRAAQWAWERLCEDTEQTAL